MKHQIKTASACYTGGGIYIYYGQLESGLYFRTADEYFGIDICDADTASEEADYLEFYEAHGVEEIPESSEDFKPFWNTMLQHIIDEKPRHGDGRNYAAYELERRFIK